MTKLVVYICGPYRAENMWKVNRNIMAAKELALKVWLEGMVALCPHANTAFFDGAASDNVWLDGDLELLSRCDALLTLPGWERSRGSIIEFKHAVSLKILVFNKLVDLVAYDRGRASSD